MDRPSIEESAAVYAEVISSMVRRDHGGGALAIPPFTDVFPRSDFVSGAGHPERRPKDAADPIPQDLLGGILASPRLRGLKLSIVSGVEDVLIRPLQTPKGVQDDGVYVELDRLERLESTGLRVEAMLYVGPRWARWLTYELTGQGDSWAILRCEVNAVS